MAHGRKFTVEVLVHRPTGYEFEFGVDPNGSLWAFYEPGSDGSRRSEHAGKWSYVVSYFGRWVERVREEHDAPDLWTAVVEQRGLIIEADVENTPFTRAEQQRIANQMSEAMEYVRATFELERDRLDCIEFELKYLVDASHRIGRLDWRNALLGSLINLAIEAVVPIALIERLLVTISRGVRGMFSDGGDLELPKRPAELE